MQTLVWIWLIILLIMGIIFLLLCTLCYLWFDASHCDFFFLVSWNLCIPIIIIELCSEMQLHYLEAVKSFQIVLLWCVWQVWSSVQYGDNYSLLLRQELSEYCTQHHIIMTFPNLVSNNTLSWCSVNIRHCFLWLYVMVLSPASNGSFTSMLQSINY